MTTAMARGVRATAPSLNAPRLCAVCGGSDVARGVRVGAERRRCGGRELWGALRGSCLDHFSWENMGQSKHMAFTKGSTCWVETGKI